jgi:hypothetical protein
MSSFLHKPILTLCLIAWVGCLASSNVVGESRGSTSKAVVPSKIEQAIYEALFQGDEYKCFLQAELDHLGDPANDIWALINPSTDGKYLPLASEGLIVGPYRSAVAALEEKLKKPLSSIKAWSARISVRPASDANAFPRRLVGPIGIDVVSGRAVVFSAVTQGPRSGTGGYYFLKHNNGTWVIEGMVSTCDY